MNRIHVLNAFAAVMLTAASACYGHPHAKGEGEVELVDSNAEMPAAPVEKTPNPGESTEAEAEADGPETPEEQP